METVARLLGPLILLAAILERVLDVFLTFVHGPSADETRDELEKCKQSVAAAKKAAEEAPGDVGAGEALEAAEENLAKA